MKTLTIKVTINEQEQMASWLHHKGFTEGEEMTTEQILITIGILENLKQQMLNKLENGKIE